MRLFARAIAALFLLCAALGLHAQSYTLGAPPLSACNVSAPGAAGNYAFNAGRWYSPQRLGPSWDFFFNDYGDLVAIWYGFNSQGHPVWYISEVKQLQTDTGGGKRWQSRLHRTSQVNGAPVLNEAVGELFVRIPANSPEKMVVSWDFLAATNLNPTDTNDNKIDCIVRRTGEDISSLPSRQINATYSGFWYPPSNSGWGYNALVVPPSSQNNNQWFEENTLLVYDANGQPAWARASRSTDMHPDSAMTVFSTSQPTVSYLTWNSATNVNGRVLSGPATNVQTPSLTFGRQYNSAGTGSMHLAWNQTLTNPILTNPISGGTPRIINFNRGTPSAPIVSSKITSTFGIVANPSPCQAAAGQTMCEVEINWEAVGAVLGRTGRPAWREITVGPNGTVASGSWTQLQTTEFQGSMMQSIPVGKRLQYGVVDFTANPAFPLYLSSEVRALPADADIEIPDDMRGAAPQEYAQPDVLAGATPIQASTVGGAASVSIPIQIPPGRHGMQPSVSLNYSSRAGSGVAGMGMSLSASMAVSRCPKTLSVDGEVGAVRYDANDRLCLDGQRLVAPPASYGLSGTTYGTEIESDTRVTQLGGALSADSGVYFKVEAKSGEVMYFGADRLGAATRPFSRVKPTGVLNNATLSWLLDTREDRSGDNVIYTYVNPASGENLLKEINYTGQNGVMAPVSTRRSVIMTYETRPDRSSSYLAGGLNVQTQRLTQIQSTAPTGTTRLYRLAYKISNSSQRSLLDSVTECGFEGVTERCLPANKLGWDDAAQSFDASPLDQRGWQNLPRPASVPANYQFVSSEFVTLGDLDGDGDREIRIAGTWMATQVGPPGFRAGYVISQNVDRATESIELLAFDDPIMLFQAREFADIDNDGRADIITWEIGNQNIVLYHYDPNKVVPGVAQTLFSSKRLEKRTTTIPLPVVRRRNESSIIVEETTNISFADVNADGWTDFVGSYASNDCMPTEGSSNGMAYYWYENQRSSATSFSNTRTQLFCLDPVNSHTLHKLVTQTQDLNGDGVVDFLLSRPVAETSFNYTTSKNPTLLDGAFLMSVSAGVAPVANYRDMAQLNLADANLEEKTFVRNWVDINGDGLVDQVYPNLVSPSSYTWHVQINQGGVFSQSFSTGSNLTIEQRLNGAIGGGFRDAALGRFGDFDNDGQTDFMAPYAFEAMGCYKRSVDSDICTGANLRSAACEELVFCPAAPNVPFVQTGTPSHQGNAAYPANFWVIRDNGASAAPGGENTLQLVDHSLNPSIYKMRVHRFTPQFNASGQITAVQMQAQAIPAQPILFAPSQTIDSQDLHADGLTDVLSEFGCGSPGLAPSPNEPSCVAIAPVEISATGLAHAMWTNYDNILSFNSGNEPLINSAVFPPRLLFSRSTGGGDRTNNLPPKSIDLLANISDAFGSLASFDYFPLASKAGRTDTDLPLYTIPARTSGQGYIDANHFYFTSSMNVVSDMKMRNGIGGFNTTRYGYEEAMYNNKGRGFSGFRKIIVEDDATKIRTGTVYHQKFPRISMVQCAASNRMARPNLFVPEPDDGLANLFASSTEANCTAPQALSFSTATYDCANSTACAQPVDAITVPIRIRSLGGSSVSRDLADRTRKVTETSTIVGYVGSNYGNPTSTTATTIDYGAVKGGIPSMVRTHTALSLVTYTEDPASWWLNKATRNEVTVSQSYGNGHAAGAPNIPIRKTITLLGYDDSHRQVNCEATFGTDTPQQIPSASATCEVLKGAEAERKTETTFDAYGNIATQTTTARNALVRSIATSFAGSNGYFPNLVTDANTKSITSGFDARFGAVISVQDANGLTTTRTLDALGRTIKVAPAARGGNSAGFPTITAYERCGGGLAICDSRAVMRVVASQFGSPQSAVYIPLGSAKEVQSALAIW